jgi:hypothetical protein
VILRALPSVAAAKVREQLGTEPVDLQREVRPDILAIVRWKFEKRLEAMMPKRPVFKMGDLLTFAGRELIALCDGLGAKALATAISGLPHAERDEFLKALPPDQRSLCARASSAAAGRRLESADAKEVLAKAAAGGKPGDAVRNAGTRRLARACVTHSPEFAANLIERHRSEFGRKIADAIREERQAPARRGDELLTEEVIAEMERLAERGVIERPLRLPPPPTARRDPPPPAKASAPAPRPSPQRSPAAPVRADPEKSISRQGKLAPVRSSTSAPLPLQPLPVLKVKPPEDDEAHRPQRIEMPAIQLPPKPKPRGPSRGG